MYLISMERLALMNSRSLSSLTFATIIEFVIIFKVGSNKFWFISCTPTQQKTKKNYSIFVFIRSHISPHFSKKITLSVLASKILYSGHSQVDSLDSLQPKKLHNKRHRIRYLDRFILALHNNNQQFLDLLKI